MSEPVSLTKLDQATRMLAEVRNIDDAKQLIDLAEAARVYARQVELGLEAQNHAAEIKLRAQRKAGEIIEKMEGTQGARTDLTSLQDETKLPKYQQLDEVGINKRDAHQWQKIAAMPEPEFEAHIQERKEAGQELTTAAIYSEARKKIRKEEIEQQRSEIAEGVAKLPDGVFEVISIDPPWPYGTNYDPNGRRAANPYPEMSLEEIQSIQLPAAQDCVLWMWTTHKFMRYSFDILDAWGFRDVAILTWVKDRMGLGTWLRSQSEFCIMAIKGKPIIDLTNQTTIIHGPLREHSRKPDEFYSMVDSLCVGRKLDYFSRHERKGWEVFGNDTRRF